jgi:hypothetical protein
MGTLPVQLLIFAGVLKNNDALLQWETINEVNALNFTVQRSTDATNFTDIGIVNAIGSANKTSYAYTDVNAAFQPATVLYYRLKIVNTNGQYSYSKIVSIILNKNINVFVFPNPVKQVLNIRLNSTNSNTLIIQISDLNGRVVYSERRAAGQNTNISVDVKQWKPQVYVVKVINSKNEVLTTQKFEKM